MSAMPGRFTSLTVISRCEASETVSCSSWSSSRWSSNSRATLTDSTGGSVLPGVLELVPVGRCRGFGRTVRSNGPLAVHASIVQAPQLLLGAFDHQVDGTARIRGLLAYGQLTLLEMQHGLRDVAV